MVERVLQGNREIGSFLLELRAQACLKFLQRLLTALDACLCAFCFLTATETVVAQFLLEIVHSSLQLLSLLVQRVGGIGTLLFQNLGVVNAELVL